MRLGLDLPLAWQRWFLPTCGLVFDVAWLGWSGSHRVFVLLALGFGGFCFPRCGLVLARFGLAPSGLALV